MALKTDISQLRNLLASRREELRDISEISAASRDTVTLDQQSVGRLSRMDALQQQAMAQAAQRRRSHDLARIEAALRRLDEDEFGYCVECGEAIAMNRLEIDPAASHCIRCAAKLD
jgi:DnaK suppressor protein